MPVYAHGHPWQRVGDSLVRMRPERLRAILSEPLIGADWSAVIVHDATLADLDDAAISKAREKFKARNATSQWAADIDDWDTETFLDKSRLSANGKITRTTLLLVGKPTAVHFLPPHPARITWSLETEERAYEHFAPPFMLTTTDLLGRIRNLPQKLFPSNSLLPAEILKYDTRVILEALHNCIAHQDYEKCERVVVTEKADRLIFENAGAFFEGSAEDYFKGTVRPSPFYSP